MSQSLSFYTGRCGMKAKSIGILVGALVSIAALADVSEEELASIGVLAGYCANAYR